MSGDSHEPAFMRRQHEAAMARAARLKWKRDATINGNSRSNGELFRKQDR